MSTASHSRALLIWRMRIPEQLNANALKNNEPELWNSNVWPPFSIVMGIPYPEAELCRPLHASTTIETRHAKVKGRPVNKAGSVSDRRRKGNQHLRDSNRPVCECFKHVVHAYTHTLVCVAVTQRQSGGLAGSSFKSESGFRNEAKNNKKYPL